MFSLQCAVSCSAGVGLPPGALGGHPSGWEGGWVLRGDTVSVRQAVRRSVPSEFVFEWMFTLAQVYSELP